MGRPSCWSSLARVSVSTVNLTALVMMNAIAAMEAFTSEISNLATDTSFFTFAYCTAWVITIIVVITAMITIGMRMERTYINVPAEQLADDLKTEQLHPHRGLSMITITIAMRE